MGLANKLAANVRSRAATEPFGVRGTIALALDEYARGRRRSARISGFAETTQTNELVGALRTKGFAAIPNFVSTEEAKRLADLLQATISNNPAHIHPSTPYDLRVNGVENLEPAFKWFSDHPLLNDVANLYLNTPTSVAFVLGASLQSVPGNPGSGGGWHRDSFGKQFKTMLYLTDVGEKDGPFQIVEGSHRFMTVVGDNTKMAQPYGNSRFKHEQVMDLIAKTGQGRLHTLGGKAGTLLLFDSSTIHRGSPIQQGTRLALTNYFYPDIDIDESLYGHFRPVAGH